MPAFIESDAVRHVWRLLHDPGDNEDEQLLTDTEVKAFLAHATRRYSLDRPLEIVADVVADGTTYSLMPATYDDGFSRIVSLEAPSGEVPPASIDGRAWALYRSPAGLRLRWIPGNQPAVGQAVRLVFTVSRSYHATVAAQTTVADADHYALCDLAASICADTMAAKFASTHDPIVGGDFANFGSKSQQWMAVAKRLEARYLAHMRLSPGPDGMAGTGIASGWANWDTTASDGRDWLFHRSRLR